MSAGRGPSLLLVTARSGDHLSPSVPAGAAGLSPSTAFTAVYYNNEKASDYSEHNIGICLNNKRRLLELLLHNLYF